MNADNSDNESTQTKTVKCSERWDVKNAMNGKNAMNARFGIRNKEQSFRLRFDHFFTGITFQSIRF